ncbi:class I SAM-dependent DNA methyltransferase [Sphingomonas sp.]|uniref:class I SAM-dependent DNA methyltransferase n=1 Tax=Sphingomonas sp. TaxID=28214 RepID=UPI003BA85AFE
MPHRIIDLYQRHAAAFDAARRNSFPERTWIERFARMLSPHAEVLDLGCGGGEPIARFLVDNGYHVTGVDSSTTLINLARTRFARHTWIEADMMRFGGDSGAYDGIVAWCSLFHLEVERQEKLIRRMGVWLRNGGVALFNTGPASGTAIGSFEGEELYHASLSQIEYRTVLAESGLTVVNHVSEDASSGGFTVWLVGKI